MKHLFALLVAVLLLSCMTMACTKAPEGTADTTAAAPSGDSGTTASTDADADTAAPTGKITYTVTVLDQNGTPVSGVAIQMCTADSCLMPAATGEDGTVSFTLTPAAYHATVAVCPEGYTAEAAEYHFEGNATALTIRVAKG